MWVFFEDGTFYSAVSDKRDKNVTWVRARDLRSAEIFADWLPGSEVLEWEGTDYAYRVRTSGDDWEQYVSHMIRTAEATNFKSEVGSNVGYGEWVRALHDVWQVMYDLQHKLRRKGSGAEEFDSFELEGQDDDDDEWNEYNTWLASRAQSKAQSKGHKLGFR